MVRGYDLEWWGGQWGAPPRPLPLHVIGATRMPFVSPLPIDQIYVPAKRAKTLEAVKVEALAEDILENGQQVPIRVREGKGRYVLIEGLHRLEALRALGEETVDGFVVHARLH